MAKAREYIPPHTCEFFVPGIPRPGGSKVSHAVYANGGRPVTKNGRIVTVTRETCKHTAGWRAAVAAAAVEHMKNRPRLFSGNPIAAHFTFYFLRPKSHYFTGKNAGKLRPDAPGVPIVRPDITKLIRSTEDALIGIVYRDDSEIVMQIGLKMYGEEAGCRICITEMVQHKEENQ